MSEPIKITFEKELTGLGKTFEREAVYGKPKIGEFYFGDLKNVELSDLNFQAVHYPILTPKKTVYTVIKVEGDFLKGDDIYGAISLLFYESNLHKTGTVQLVTE